MLYTVKISISLKQGMLDPEASAIRHALLNLGYETDDLKTARVYIVRFSAADRNNANEKATKMCERLLANPVIHSYSIEVME
jgi:phosphoribosylformylglycinamidine synthase PurS subunit